MADKIIQMPLELLWYIDKKPKRDPEPTWDLVPIEERPTEKQAFERVLFTQGNSIVLSARDKQVLDAERKVLLDKRATMLCIDVTGYVSHEIDETWVYPQVQRILASRGIVASVHDIVHILVRVSKAYEAAAILNTNVVFVQDKRLQYRLQKAS